MLNYFSNTPLGRTFTEWNENTLGSWKLTSSHIVGTPQKGNT